MTLQVPALLFTALVCGHRPAMLAGMAYISLGLFQLPVFQSGGGLSYLSDPAFGYLAEPTSGLADGTASSAAGHG